MARLEYFEHISVEDAESPPPLPPGRRQFLGNFCALCKSDNYKFHFYEVGIAFLPPQGDQGPWVCPLHIVNRVSCMNLPPLCSPTNGACLVQRRARLAP